MKRCQQSHEQCSNEEEDDELGVGDHNQQDDENYPDGENGKRSEQSEEIHG